MKFSSSKSVETYETAINITQDKIDDITSDPNDIAQFMGKLLNKRTINVAKYFTKEDVEKLRLMRINLRYNRIHSPFEILALQSDIRLYMINPPEKVPYLPKPNGITDDDIIQLFLITVRIMEENK